MRIAPEGWPIILALALATALCAGVGWLSGPVLAGVLGGVGLVFTLWGVWFFRDPQRTPPPASVRPGAALVISPADGRVIKIDSAPIPTELRDSGRPAHERPMRRVAIFLNIFDVHVNRVPSDGRITRLAYRPGKFLNASLDKASEHNERSAALMTDGHGREIAFVQIAGLIAWRIVNHLRLGQAVTAGERFGLIRFGSRAEIYLPDDAAVEVNVGDRVVAGQSILATLPDPSAGRGEA